MMPHLPAAGSSWPPHDDALRYERMTRPEAWYSGDPARLGAAYGSGPAVETYAGTSYNPERAGMVKRVAAAIRNEFWQRSTTEQVSTKRHMPVPEGIARASARLLFGEQVEVRVVDPQPGQDGKPSPVAVAAQARLEELLEACNLPALLLSSAELSSALGSVALRIAFDKASMPLGPVLTWVHPRAVLPSYSWGQQTGVAFWSVVAQTQTVVVRHIELHAGGFIWHGLYSGTADKLGDRLPLDASPTTAHLAPLCDDDGKLRAFDAGGPTAVSIPNMLPDPTDPQNRVGRSDFTPAVMDLFDAIDRTYSQMMEELEDGRSKLFIADHLLQRGLPGQGQTFDPNQRLYTQVKQPPGEDSNTLPIMQVQFAMRMESYLATIDALTRKAFDAAGYTARTDAGQDGRDLTATEVRSNDSLSLGTRDTKALYWRPALQQLLTTLLRIDVQEFAPVVGGQRVQALPVQVNFPDTLQPTLRELGETVEVLRRAQAVSTLEAVRTVHPEWDDQRVREEVQAIQAAASVVDPVSFGTGGEGL